MGEAAKARVHQQILTLMGTLHFAYPTSSLDAVLTQISSFHLFFSLSGIMGQVCHLFLG